MKKKRLTGKTIFFVLMAASLFLCTAQITTPGNGAMRIQAITDALGRTIDVPIAPRYIICSGSGCLRYITYMEAQDRVVAVDDMEKRPSKDDTKPYAMANPRFRSLPLFEEFREYDNPELILGLDPQPQVIFKIHNPAGGYDPDELQKKTGIPVVVLQYGDLTRHRDDMFGALRLIGTVLKKEERAERVISFFLGIIADLDKRTRDIPDSERKTCYVGGISFKGPHGFLSTDPGYEPLAFLHTKSVAYEPKRGGKQLSQMNVSKERIIQWNPRILFIDLGSMQQSRFDALHELTHDPVYRELDAKRNGSVYTVLPYNAYATNFSSVLADAYFIGSILYPERFSDVIVKNKADEIYTFLVGTPLFDRLDAVFDHQVFKRMAVR